MHKSEKSQKSPNFLREFCVGKPVGYAEILTFGNIFCTFYLTVKKVLRQGYFSSGSPALTYSGLSTPNAPCCHRSRRTKFLATHRSRRLLHIRIFRHRTPLVSRRNRQTKFLDSHRNHPTPPLAVYRNRRTEPIAAHQNHQGNSVPSAGKKKTYNPTYPQAPPRELHATHRQKKNTQNRTTRPTKSDGRISVPVDILTPQHSPTPRRGTPPTIAPAIRTLRASPQVPKRKSNRRDIRTKTYRRRFSDIKTSRKSFLSANFPPSKRKNSSPGTVFAGNNEKPTQREGGQDTAPTTSL